MNNIFETFIFIEKPNNNIDSILSILIQMLIAEFNPKQTNDLA